MAEQYQGQEPINVRRCDIERLKKKLAKARHDRDEWRKRAEIAERLVRDGSSAIVERLRSEEAQRYRAEIVTLQKVIAERCVEQLRTPPRRTRAGGSR